MRYAITWDLGGPVHTDSRDVATLLALTLSDARHTATVQDTETGSQSTYTRFRKGDLVRQSGGSLRLVTGLIPGLDVVVLGTDVVSAQNLELHTV